MWKWLHSWFAWRFSLRRLVVATVFLGAVVGLNAQPNGPTATYLIAGGRVSNRGDLLKGYYWGWPVPFAYKTELCERDVFVHDKASDQPEPTWHRPQPWTHGTYNLPWHYVFRIPSLTVWTETGWYSILLFIIDIVVGMIPLVLILFFQPRRIPPEAAK